MAEAFGIAGSAFGAISLGLQLFQHISQYLDDVEGRDQDLERARNYAKLVQTSLIALHGAVIHATTNSPPAEYAINQCETSCAVAIDSLLKAIKEVKGSEAVSNNRIARAKELYVKLKYPFKKSNIENLEKRLFYTNSFLRTALNVLQLDNQNATRSSIMSVQQTVNSIQLSTEDNRMSQERTQEASNQLYEALQFVHHDVREVLTRLREPSETICVSRPPMLNGKSPGAISNSASTLRNPNYNTAVSSIKSTKYQSGNSFTINSFCCCRSKGRRRNRRHWGPFIIETEISFTDHHAPGCPMSKVLTAKHQTKRILNFAVPAIQSRWRNYSQFSLSFTIGTNALGLGQSLAWVATVDADSSPSFGITMRAISYTGSMYGFTHEDQQTLLSSCFRRLIWCFTNNQASIDDVDRHGQSILDRVSSLYCITAKGEFLLQGNALPTFWMLANFINPATYTSADGSLPFLAEICQNTRAPNSEMIVSLLSGRNETAGQECKSRFYSCGYQQRFDLVRDVPRVAEYLEFGQLSIAIIKGDQDQVQNWLEKCPSSINEINYLGRSPIHLAIQIQNVAILEILLKYADAKILNIADNDGYYPIDHATDALCHVGQSGTGKDTESCNGCMMLDLLLQSETALFGCSIRRALDLPFYHEVPSCKEGQKRIIQNLASRRRKLEELARRELSPSERRDLKICQAGVLDQNAAQVQQYLEARTYYVPTRLRVHDNAGTPEDSQSIYTFIRQGEIAEYALQSGFSHSEAKFQEVFGLLPLWLTSSYNPYPHQGFLFSSYVCWMVDHGADLSCYITAAPAPALGGYTTAAHYFMAYLGTGMFILWGSRTPLSPEVSNVVLSEDVLDDCRCWCSPRGCTPLTKLLSTMERLVIGSDRRPTLDRLIKVISKTLRDIFDLFGEGGYELVDRPCVDSAILRYYTFTMLDLRHTCCCLVEEVSGPLSEEECQEIREEDSTRLEMLEELVMEFETERRNFTELASFMQGYWAPKMRMVDQELASLMLTEEQRREAERVGVVWVSHGPQLSLCSNGVEVDKKLSGEVISTLEQALRDLDEIATDPERPFVR